MPVFRCYTEKKKGFDNEAQAVLRDLRDFLGIRGLASVRLLNRYDVEGVTESVWQAARTAVFSEPQTDECYSETPPGLSGEMRSLNIEALPGQFDQRADACSQCILLLAMAGQRDQASCLPLVKTARTYIFGGDITDSDMERIRDYVINPVESREALSTLPETLVVSYPQPGPVGTIQGFITADEDILTAYHSDFSLAMDMADLRFLQAYFSDEEKRDPTVTELRVVDTYWSDHCRHTTFLTHITDVSIDDPNVSAAYETYLAARREVYGSSAADRPQTLMDIATIAAKALRVRGLLGNLDVSDEVNACSIHIEADVGGKPEDWLLMFKNETHNHPTEVEPFGGAATCIGGAIRDPLSGRAFVYQAMRVTGSGDPRTEIKDTIPGKLPQRKITVKAAQGYSSYGNQIGLATGLVHEFYHPGYAAKRLELGAVVGAVRADNIIRKRPAPGDAVILLGGRTGRDGIGGATGSSKSHTPDSLVTMASEVQKGNAPEERKIQRLFLDPEVTGIIKKCNDFGAGGISVAVGELADGVDIDLSLVRRKYEGLDGTEIAISESQERMAVVVAARDVDAFIKKAGDENLEAYVIATITGSPRMIMRHGGKVIVDLSREFLSTNGAVKHTAVHVPDLRRTAEKSQAGSSGAAERLRALAGDLRFCSRRGLLEMFDGTVGASSVLMKTGGKTQSTPVQVMASTLPVQDMETTTCSVMAFGFDPCLSSENPFEGAKAAVVTSVAKLVAAGCDPQSVFLSFQEYFERLRDEPSRWGKPFSALLGAFEAQMELGLAAIGGKDSMSGSYQDMDVPPTLVSFAIAPDDARNIISPEFKEAGHDIVVFGASGDLSEMKNTWKNVRDLIADKSIVSAWAVTEGNAADGLLKMSLGNEIGFQIDPLVSPETLFSGSPGALVAEITRPVQGAVKIGRTIAEPVIKLGDETISIYDLKLAWEDALEVVFPTRATAYGEVSALSYAQRPQNISLSSEPDKLQAGSSPAFIQADIAKPRALVFAFPGTNSELDTARAVSRAGGFPKIIVIRNLTPSMLLDSIAEAARSIRESQILIIPGGFSFGDEPDGSAKFITVFFRNPVITDAVHEHLKSRDGLILGICNGFQALIKLGLVPFGEIVSPDDDVPLYPYITGTGADAAVMRASVPLVSAADRPTLTHNVIGRHQAGYVYTRVASVNSPWMDQCSVGDVHAIAVSHGEGRFIASGEMLRQLSADGRIATQYCDINGTPSMERPVNPNGSQMAVEGLFSPDGRVFGKMGHTERRGEFVAKNIYGEKHQPVFESGIGYFR